MAEQLSSGASFAIDILNNWRKVIDSGNVFRYNYQQGIKNKAVKNVYASELITLWLQLYPKVVGRTDMQKLEEKFKCYAKYHENPRLLKKGKDLHEFETMLREVIEKLGITKW